jgi:hypothetical protein
MSVSPNQNNKKENGNGKQKIKIQDQRSRPVTNWPVTNFLCPSADITDSPVHVRTKAGRSQ